MKVRGLHREKTNILQFVILCKLNVCFEKNYLLILFKSIFGRSRFSKFEKMKGIPAFEKQKHFRKNYFHHNIPSGVNLAEYEILIYRFLFYFTSRKIKDKFIYEQNLKVPK